MFEACFITKYLKIRSSPSTVMQGIYPVVPTLVCHFVSYDV